MLLSGLILPPQLLILALFQILLEIHLYNTLTGLILVYVATHVAVTVIESRSVIAYFGRYPCPSAVSV